MSGEPEILVRAFLGLLATEELLQHQIVESFAAFVQSEARGAPAEGTTQRVTGLAECAMEASAARAWQYSEDRLPYRQMDWQQQQLDGSSRHIPLRPDMSLTLDVFDVAQHSPSTCQALFLTPLATLESAVSAAVTTWLTVYAQKCMRSYDASVRARVDVLGNSEGLAYHGAAGEDDSAAMLMQAALPWPEAWSSVLVRGEVFYEVRLLLLRIPSFYISFTTGSGGGGGGAAKSLVRDTWGEGLRMFDLITAASPSISTPTQQPGPASLAAAEEAQVQCLRLSHMPLPTVAYPSDRFLEASLTVQVIGVVHQICYDSHTTEVPAPWVTLFLLPRPRAPHGRRLGCCLSMSPVRREVDLRALQVSQRWNIAVIGSVVEVRGHTLVARRRCGMMMNGTAMLRSRGASSASEVPLVEYIVATWATLLLPSSELLSSWVPRRRAIGGGDGQAFVQDLEGASPSLKTVALEDFTQFPSGGGAGLCRDGKAALAMCDEVVGITAGEEEAAARASLSNWEGARLALGMSDVEGDGASCSSVTPFFSVSLDIVVASQIALVSAQMPDGLTVLTLDEAVPESFLTRLLRRMDCVAPCATLEVPSSVLCHAKPSFFLPTYRTRRVPAVAGAILRSPTVASVAGTRMGPPSARCPPYSSTHSCGGVSSATTVTAPPPPYYSEVICGGALSHASGRTLVLQRIEVLPVTTLKVLQEALHNPDELRMPSELGAASVEKVNTASTHAAASPNRLIPTASFRAVCSSDRTRASVQLPSVPVSSARKTRRVVQREGGQSVAYNSTHNALCSIRQGSSLTQHGHLVEFASHCDVVVRPAFDTQRQMMALCGSTDRDWMSLLHCRGEAWLQLLGATVNFHCFPRALCLGGEGSHTSSIASEIPAPTLTEACSRLLSTYFVAAKARCLEATDASMMHTLVKLTLAHALWRSRLTALRLQVLGTPGVDLKPHPPSSVKTALIDAVAAVGLCDVTLHFFTGTTLLGQCVFRLLEGEAWPIWEAESEVRHPAHAQATAPDDCADGRWAAQPVCGDERAIDEEQRHQVELEFRTRLPPPQTVASPASLRSSFSIVQLVEDLQHHLERTMHQAATSAPP